MDPLYRFINFSIAGLFLVLGVLGALGFYSAHN